MKQRRQPWETHVIVNLETDDVVQYDTERHVYKNCEVLNTHEEKNGRPRVYAVREVQE